MSYYEQVLQGDIRATAKLIRQADDAFERAKDDLKKIHAHTGKAAVVGVTGNPGAGKSSLVDRMIDCFREDGRKVGVIAIDPTSPFTGGAIMGDRVRMERHFADEKVFIRSMATRGHLGGLSKSTGEIIRIMEAWGADPVIVETVGVGQAEIDIVNMADTSIVVMTPGMGDEVQAIKAGVMEIADIFVVNKADRAGADKTANEVRMMLEMAPNVGKGNWMPKILMTVAFRNEGVKEVVEAVYAHRTFLKQAGELKKKKREREALHFYDLLQDSLKHRVFALLSEAHYEGWKEKLAERTLDPYSLVEQLEKEMLR